MPQVVPMTFLTLALFASGAAAETRQVFMRTSGPTCRDASTDTAGSWRCPGPSGYSVDFFDEGNLVGVRFNRFGKSLNHGNTEAVWRGAQKAFGNVLEWRINERGIPVAAILRTWTIGEEEKAIQLLRIFALNAEAVCIHAIVATTSPSANQRAAAEAEKAARVECDDSENDLSRRSIQDHSSMTKYLPRVAKRTMSGGLR